MGGLGSMGRGGWGSRRSPCMGGSQGARPQRAGVPRPPWPGCLSCRSRAGEQKLPAGILGMWAALES